MSLAGGGAVAIWHDIALEGRADFYAWHGEEHMPERAAIPGFLRGRRYAAIHGKPEFFNLYETASAGMLAGGDYLDRLNHPTPWTLDTVAHFRHVARSLCEVAASAGTGDGGLIATLRYAVDDAVAQKHRAHMASQAIPAISTEAGIAGAHLLVADVRASAVETEERKARDEATAIPGWIVLLEGWGDVEPFVRRAAAFAAYHAFSDYAIEPDWGVYRLQNQRLAPGWPTSAADAAGTTANLAQGATWPGR